MLNYLSPVEDILIANFLYFLFRGEGMTGSYSVEHVAVVDLLKHVRFSIVDCFLFGFAHELVCK